MNNQTGPSRSTLPAIPGLPPNPMLAYQQPYGVHGTGGYASAYSAPQAGYLHPQQGGHINPAFMLNRTSLFQPINYSMVPTHNPEGYSYSSAFVQQQAEALLPTEPESHKRPNEPPQSPNKRQRISSSGTSNTTRGRPAFVPGSVAAARAGSWRNCIEPSCNFVGPEKEVEIHEGDRHLIFKEKKKVEMSEEEEALMKMKKGGPPPPIPGTSITLQTDEDIAKWIAQRRANWPTAKRAEEKEKERQERLARGELEFTGRGRGRGGRGRGVRGGRDDRSGRGGRQQRDTRREEGTQVAVAAHEEKKVEGQAEGERKSESDIDSDMDSEAELGDDETRLANLKPENLMSEERRKMLAQEDDVHEGEEEEHHEQDERPKFKKRICKFFAGNGKCRNGDRCGFLHERSEKDRSNKVKGDRSLNKAKAGEVQRSSLLGSLLQGPIAQTLSQLSQVIAFLADNDFLDGVELAPGQAEEVEKIRSRVVVVAESKEEGDEREVKEVVADTTIPVVTEVKEDPNATIQELDEVQAAAQEPTPVEDFEATAPLTAKTGDESVVLEAATIEDVANATVPLATEVQVDVVATPPEVTEVIAEDPTLAENSKNAVPGEVEANELEMKIAEESAGTPVEIC